MSYIYIASPYTHPDPKIMEARYEQVAAFTAYMLNKGLHVYSPIVHCHELAKNYDLPRHAGFWEAYNITMLRAAAQLTVLRLEDWQTSRGVQKEISIAELLHMTIRHALPLEGEGK